MIMEWQPIETAPKDGRSILLGGGLWDDEDVSEVIGLAHWDEKSKGWLVACHEGGYVCAWYTDATHWMPLPEPPQK